MASASSGHSCWNVPFPSSLIFETQLTGKSCRSIYRVYWEPQNTRYSYNCHRPSCYDDDCSAELAPNYSRTTTELAELIWLPPHLVWSCWNGIVRPSAPYKRSPELRSILIRTGRPSDTRRTYQTEYGWISDVEQSNRTPIPSHRIRT